MGASLWDKLWLPLLIGVAIQIVVTALCCFSARLWKCLTKQIKIQTAVGESAHDQPLPESDGPANLGGVSMPELELELGIANGGEGIEHFSDQETHPPVIKFAETTPKAQFTRDAARGALVPVEMDIPDSQQEVQAAE